MPASDPKDRESQALLWAAMKGHVECARILLPVSAPLCEIHGLIEQVIEAGQAKAAALLLGEEPRLLDGVNLHELHQAALEKKQGDLAPYLSSLMDQKDLSSLAPDLPALGGLRQNRL